MGRCGSDRQTCRLLGLGWLRILRQRFAWGAEHLNSYTTPRLHHDLWLAELRRLIWTLLMYKCLAPEHANPESLQAASSPIISHSQLSFIICPAIVSAGTCLPIVIGTETNIHIQFFHPPRMQPVSKLVLALAVICNAMFAVALPNPVPQVLPSDGTPPKPPSSGSLLLRGE